jgi:carbamoyltransferase
MNAFHGDASACILKDGQLLAAAEEERFSRIKHDAGFPAQAVAYCLQVAKAHVRDLDVVAVNSNSLARISKKISYSLRQPPSPLFLVERLRHRRARTDIAGHFDKHLGALGADTRIHHIEHHRCHLASTYYFSPFERASVLSVDGFGDFCSAAWGTGDGLNLTLNGEVLFPHSLGIFYQAMTQFLGFAHYGDEYKLMGLAPYGEPIFMDQMGQLLKPSDSGGFSLGLKYFVHHQKKMSFQWPEGAPLFDPMFSAGLEDLLGPARTPGTDLSKRHKDIACSVQRHFERVLFNLLESLYRTDKLEDLCLAGGCAMNSVAVGKIHAETPFKHVYVQPAAGDAGGALGAAICAELSFNNGLVRPSMLDAGWGPEFDDAYIERLLTEHESDLLQANVEVTFVESADALCLQIASAIADGEVVGWFQGRMEWGPRALGHRSILADPRRADMKSILNKKIKKRESFRPFAPSILREAVSDWFEIDDDVPFMTKVLRIRADQCARIPAVAHIDGSGRLQTVSREQNLRFYELISRFAEQTGVPILLNTSFNENEPIVCRPEEAIDCFLRTEMDWLVLNRYAIRRMREGVNSH